jgi:hypothetical protein
MGGLARAPELIAAAVRSSPGGGKGWTPAEVAAHLADTEIVTGWRIRQTLAIDEPNIQPYDQDAWASALQYGQRDTAAALNTFRVMRSANLEVLRIAGDSALDRYYNQPEYGRMTLRQLIAHKSDHDLAHLKQIRGG